MNYEFYADVFFLTNFYLDFLAVYAVSEALQQTRRLRRYLFCSVLGSLAGCVLFLLLPDYGLYQFAIHCIVNPGMAAGCFFPAGKKVYIKAYVLMYVVTMLLGGSVEWLYGTLFGGRFYELSLLLSAVPIGVFLYIVRRRRKNVSRFYPVEIGHGDKTIALRALYDTGNTLYDPYIKAAVHIVSRSVFEALGGKEAFPVRLIPFSSVGCKRGMLEAFTVEWIKIGEAGEEITLSPAVLAAAEDTLFFNRTYQMVLHNGISEKMPLSGTQGI